MTLVPSQRQSANRLKRLRETKEEGDRHSNLLDSTGEENIARECTRDVLDDPRAGAVTNRLGENQSTRYCPELQKYRLVYSGTVTVL